MPLLIDQMEMAESLFEIEPPADYAERGSSVVAMLAGAKGHRLELSGAEVPISSGSEMGHRVDITLTHGGTKLGTLSLWLDEGDGQATAEWAARIFARGLAYSRRLEDGPREVDIQALLASTPLTPRERDVVGRLVSGHSTRAIASSTGLTVATVNTYLKRIFAKLGVHSRVELLARVTGTRNAVSMGTTAEA